LAAEIMKKNMDNKKYTPLRANLFKLDQILTEFKKDEKISSERKKKCEYFAHKFWISCKCTKFCYSKVPIDQALDIYEKFAEMDKITTSISLGAILKNFQMEKSDSVKRLDFRYQIADSHVCKDLFSFIYNTTNNKLNRLFECIKKNGKFFCSHEICAKRKSVFTLKFS
jgi:hypothetical protein